MDDQAADAIGLTAEHRVHEPTGMRLPPIFAIDWKLFARGCQIQVRILLVGGVIDGEMTVQHGKPDPAGHVQLICKCEQRVHRTDGLYTAVGILQPCIHHRSSASGIADAASKIPDGLSRDASDGFGNLRSEMLHIGLQLFEAQAPVFSEVLVVQIFVDHYFNHAER